MIFIDQFGREFLFKKGVRFSQWCKKTINEFCGVL